MTEILNTPVTYNVTDAVIATMAQEYMGLTVAGVEDREGLARVHAARMTVKGKRVEVEKKRKELKADALEYGRKVDAEAARITALLDPIEKHLAAEETRIEQEKERLRKEKEEAELRRVMERVERLKQYGATADPAVVRYLTDEQFAEVVEKARLAWQEAELVRMAEEAEAERIAQEAMAAEEEIRAKEAAEAEAGRVELERLRKESEAQKAELARLRAEIEARAAATPPPAPAPAPEPKGAPEPQVAEKEAPAAPAAPVASLPTDIEHLNALIAEIDAIREKGAKILWGTPVASKAWKAAFTGFSKTRMVLFTAIKVLEA